MVGQMVKNSARVSVLNIEAKSHFHLSEGDSHVTKIAKMAVLEEEFQQICGDPVELEKLWRDADTNRNGDLSLTEWTSCVMFLSLSAWTLCVVFTPQNSQNSYTVRALAKAAACSGGVQ
jgi:hypothetical protein